MSTTWLRLRRGANAPARDSRLANRTHGSDLPASWRTLYELTRLDGAEGVLQWLRRPAFQLHYLGLVSLLSALHQAAKAIRRLAQGVIVHLDVCFRG